MLNVVTSRKYEYMFKHSLACIENSQFIMKRHYRSDFSVNYSQYLFMNITTYEEYVPLQSLNYTGNAVPAENHTNPNPLNYSWVETDVLGQSLSTSLGTVEQIDINRKINYYVVYAAIDLMNYHYTKLDPTGKKIVSFSIHCLSCSGSFLLNNLFTILPMANMMIFVMSWIISVIQVFAKKMLIKIVNVLIE